MGDYLFIYGTLLPGFEPRAMSQLCRRLNSIGPATIRGQLFDLGPYPAVVIDAARAGSVRGEVVEVDGDATWQELDRYEGCPREGQGDGLFRRLRTVATCDTGESVNCWVYVYNRDLS